MPVRIAFFIALSAFLPLQLDAGIGEWTSLGLPGESVCVVLPDAYSSLNLFAGTCGNGIFKATDSGATWAAANAGIACPAAVSSLRQQGPSTLYTETRETDNQGTCSALMRSTDGGVEWAPVNPPQGGLAGPLFLDLRTSPRLYTFSDFWVPFHLNDYVLNRSSDGGITWASLRSEERVMTNLLVDPTNPSHLYLLSDAIEESTDDGQTWADLAGEFFNGFVPKFLALDPFHPNVLYATAGSQIVKSTDGGHNWTAFWLIDPSITNLIFDPFHVGILYILDSSGVQRSTDAGATWNPLNAGLDGQTVNTLAFDPLGGKLFAGTSGQGIMEYQFAAPTTCNSDPDTLCLAGGRFQVQAQWTDFNGNSGLGTVVPGAVSNNSGVLWFFSPDNWELLIKVLDGCGMNGHYWVFGGAATNVAYTIQVTDTQAGEVKTYTNPLGTTSPAITDTSAFGSCP